ncbi:MAG: glycosyltransferase family 4 protein [Alphaproteobacteria bacterium]
MRRPLRAAFYAPLKAPDDPTPSGDRRIARLFQQAFDRIDVETPLASRFRSREAKGDPARQAQMASLGPALGRRAIRAIGPPSPAFWFTYHLYYKAADWFGPEAAAAMDIPYIVAEASYAPKRAGGLWDLSHRRVAYGVQQAAAVLCLNPNDVACLEPITEHPEKLISFPPFLDVAPYSKIEGQRAADRAAFGQQHGLPDDAVWVLAVGMMRRGDKEASFAALAHALAVLETDRDWRLIVVGDGPAQADIMSALQNAAPHRVAFAGALDEATLARYYAAADLMAWPAIGEAFGMAMLEAQASGLPVVAGNVGGVGAVVADGVGGLLVPQGDDHAFAAAMAALIKNDQRRLIFGAGAAARIRETQSLDAAADRLETILQRISVR